MVSFHRKNLSILSLILWIACLIGVVNCEISMIKYYEAEHTLAHVIKSVKQNNLEQIDDEYEQKCTKSNDCCVCNKNFRNSSYLELHMKIHHPLIQQKPEDYMLTQIFDKKLNSEFRFQTCLKLMNLVDLSKILQREKSLWTSQSHQTGINTVQFSNRNIKLNKSQIVEACTIIAYGAYHQPLWMVWIKGTLIFVFAIVFLVYYANIVDELNGHYFPKKRKNSTEQ